MATEGKILEIIAVDRIDVPISSMSGKLKRQKKKLGQALELKNNVFNGDRVYARTETDSDLMTAGSVKKGIEEGAEAYPRHGKILKGMIEEQRAASETHLYFGMNSGCRLTSEDYLGVMENLGFKGQYAENLYQELMKVSRNLSRKRGDERSIMVG